jgi:hypothetical protein
VAGMSDTANLNLPLTIHRCDCIRSGKCDALKKTICGSFYFTKLALNVSSHWNLPWTREQ